MFLLSEQVYDFAKSNIILVIVKNINYYLGKESTADFANKLKKQ